MLQILCCSISCYSGLKEILFITLDGTINEKHNLADAFRSSEYKTLVTLNPIHLDKEGNEIAARLASEVSATRPGNSQTNSSNRNNRIMLRELKACKRN